MYGQENVWTRIKMMNNDKQEKEKGKKNRKKEKNQGKSNKLSILILLAYVIHHNCMFNIKLILPLLPIMVETKEEAAPSDAHGSESSGDKKTFSGGKAFKKKNKSGHVDKKMKECLSC